MNKYKKACGITVVGNKRALLLLFIYVTFHGCQKKTASERIFNFSIFNHNDSLIKNHYFKKQVFLAKDYDSVAIYSGDSLQVTFLEKVTSKGLFRSMGKDFELSHPFFEKSRVNFSTRNTPFLNKHVEIHDKFLFTVNGSRYEVFSFYEWSLLHEGYISYYIIDKGFVAYLNVESCNYIICDNINSSNSVPILNKIRLFIHSDIKSLRESRVGNIKSETKSALSGASLSGGK